MRDSKTGNFKIYNTLTRKKEAFESIRTGLVGMYVCGVTPYSEAHLGHARCYVVFDTLRRYLEFLGYEVTYVQNITDIDDKIIAKSMETGDTPSDIASRYFSSFMGEMEKLNVKPADIYPRVTENIDKIISFIKALIKKGSAYEISGSVYFRVSSLDGYGDFSGRGEGEKVIGEESKGLRAKKDPRDFALWKQDPEYGWDSPWGQGRPGWHIECSAMSKDILGDFFDIHGGGLDLLFPHHENEIAQSTALTGRVPARYWVHNGMVTLRGDKMAKSTGNLFLLNEALKEVSPGALRIFLLSSSYRQSLDYDPEALKGTEKAFRRLVELKEELIRAGKFYEQGFCDWNDPLVEALSDDLNTARTLGRIFTAAGPLLEKIYGKTHTEDDAALARRIIFVTEEVLGIELNTPSAGMDNSGIEELISRREKLRNQRRFGEADVIRDKLLEKGIEIKDTPSGPRWRKVSPG